MRVISRLAALLVAISFSAALRGISMTIEPAAVRTREDFLAFAGPGYAKAAIAFLVRPERGGSRVVTETRIAGTSPEATRALLRYWVAIWLGSGAIRRSWLAAIRRRAARARPHRDR